MDPLSSESDLSFVMRVCSNDVLLDDPLELRGTQSILVERTNDVPCHKAGTSGSDCQHLFMKVVQVSSWVPRGGIHSGRSSLPLVLLHKERKFVHPFCDI